LAQATAFQKATITGGEQQWQQLSLRSEIATATVRQVAIMLSEVMGEYQIKYLSNNQLPGTASKQLRRARISSYCSSGSR